MGTTQGTARDTPSTQEGGFLSSEAWMEAEDTMRCMAGDGKGGNIVGKAERPP